MVALCGGQAKFWYPDILLTEVHNVLIFYLDSYRRSVLFIGIVYVFLRIQQRPNDFYLFCKELEKL